VPSYRYCVLNKDGRIITVEHVECANEGAAIAHAEMLLARSDHPMIEVWDGSEKILTMRKSDLRRP